MGKKSKKKAAPSRGSTSLPSATSPSNFSVGDRVKLHSLKTTKYNGRHGVVKSLPSAAEDRYGILLDGADARIAIRTQNIALIERARKSTKEQLKEFEQATSHLHLPKEHTMNSNQMAMFRTMTNMFMTDEKQVQIFGRKIDLMPDFQSEVMNEQGGIPIGVDKKWAKEFLKHSYEQCSSLPHLFEFAFKQETWKPEKRYIFKRLGLPSEEKLRWLLTNTKPGNIYKSRSPVAYTALIRHSFSNQAYRKEVLHRGKTHVAVGFVDLGMLFASDVRDSPGGPSRQPLKFIGVEMSAYSVAKAHVVWEMLLETPSISLASNRESHLRQVAQVWYSASWEEATFESAKRALIKLCDPKNAYHEDVRELLLHWRDCPRMPLSKARKKIKEVTTTDGSEIGHLLKKRDRIAFAKYELTKDFGISPNCLPLCGNILMFDCPDGTPPLMKDETIFSAFRWPDLMSVLQSGDASGMNVMQAAQSYAIRGLDKMATYATSRAVVIQLKCAAIEDVAHEVAASQPWTMSWSNVCDYMHHHEFHRLARACSIHGDTVHYGYSMNWSTDVFGTSLIDFSGKQCEDIRASIVDTANQAVAQLYKEVGWDQHLRLPPPTNPLNTTQQYGLGHVHYNTWVNYFFDLAKKEGPVQVCLVEHAVGSPLAWTGGSTVAFTWTYDPDIKFQGMMPTLSGI